ncbi:MAG: hypothetical protein IAG13_00825 [Deltaproteobacteria bacterium]|nr:hypothetical protein [Nannocystaceae bacterium]
MEPRDRWNLARWHPEASGGHYESWFVRANHPARPLAFWIRYTIFAPRDGSPAIGELWAIVFDGDRKTVRAAKQELAIERCSFDRERLDVRIGESRLEPGQLLGTAEGTAHRIGWSLAHRGDAPPLLLLPESLYAGGFPKAKTVVPAPLVRFSGELVVDGERIVVDDWLGSQNHNWGARHTDRYAWGQVAGFDGQGDAFLECSTAKLRIGPLWTPWMTVAVLRIGAREHAFNTLGRAAFAKASIDGLSWRFDTGNGRERLRVHVEAPRKSFVGLRYRNPPGGVKICLNCKIARADVELDLADGTRVELHTADRAAFELLGDDAQGIEVVA